MKKFVFLSLLLCFSTCLFAQDIILTTDHEIIKAKVITVYDAVVKYAPYEDPDGETPLILKSKIISITYENGEVEGFQHENENNTESNLPVTNQVTKPVNSEMICKNFVRVNPLVTFLGAIQGFFDLELQYARYLTPKIAVPVDLEIAYVDGIIGIAVMTGIEAVPVTHRQKSGLFLNALVGPMFIGGMVGVVTNGNIGYQLLTRNGFTFNFGLGPLYDSLSNEVKFHVTLNIGAAF